MENKRFHLVENKIYWIALIISLMTLAPTNRDRILWFGLAAILCSTILFCWINLGSKYISRYVKEHGKQSILILLYCIAHSAVLSKSFFLMWLPSNKLMALASRFHLSNAQFLNIIILLILPCMLCSLFVICSFLLSKYQRDQRRTAEIILVLFLALMAFQSSQGISCGLVGNMQLKHMFCGTLIVLALIALANTFFSNIKISVLLGSLPFLIFSTINYYVYNFRGREICPYDILSVRTALNVASDYHFFFSLFVLIGWLAWVFLMTAFFLTKREAAIRKKQADLILSRSVSCRFSWSLSLKKTPQLNHGHLLVLLKMVLL